VDQPAHLANVRLPGCKVRRCVEMVLISAERRRSRLHCGTSPFLSLHFTHTHTEAHAREIYSVLYAAPDATIRMLSDPRMASCVVSDNSTEFASHEVVHLFEVCRRNVFSFYHWLYTSIANDPL